MNRLFLVLILFFAHWTSAYSKDDPPSMIATGANRALVWTINKVSLEINDSVEDLCMPRPNDVLRSAEATMRRNGFDIVDGSFPDATIQLNVLGHETSSTSCAVHFQALLKAWRMVSVPFSGELDTDLHTTLSPLQWDMYGSLLSGSKSTMQTRLEREAEKAANEIFIQIDKSRDHVKDSWPSLWNEWVNVREN